MKQGSALRNNEGFTLIEMLVAMVIILVALLGLVQAALLSIDSNLRNILRDEAVRIADQRMNGVLIDTANIQHEGLRNVLFDNADLAAPGPRCFQVARNFRNIVRNYTVCVTITDLARDSMGQPVSKRVNVFVGWDHKNENPPQAPTGREFQQVIAPILRKS